MADSSNLCSPPPSQRHPIGLPDESSIPWRPFCIDLNEPPPRMTAANADLSEGISFQFEPITPEKTNLVECSRQEELNIRNLGTNDEEHLVRGDVSEKMPSAAAVKGHHETKQKTAAVGHNHMPLTPGQEKNKPDKGRSTEEPDSIKTPQQQQQRPRRRKHRPKVVIEGQRKTTPKQRASVPKEATVQKKYVRRRKGANSTPAKDDEKHETGSNIDSSTSNYTPAAEQRKYVRRKRLDELKDTIEKKSTDSTDLNTTRLTRRSCRRSLNFTSEGLMSDCGMGSEAQNFKAKMMENFSNDPILSTDQALEGYLSGGNEDLSSHLQHTKSDPKPDYPHTAKMGKCQIVFSDVTHDKEANAFEGTVDPHNKQATQNYSVCSRTNFSEEREARILKRPHASTYAEAEVCRSNATRKFCDFKEIYLSLFSQNSTSGMHFPNICKKKRTEKVLGAATSSFQPATSHFQLSAFSHSPAWLLPSRTNQGSFSTPKATDLLMNNHSADGTHASQRIFRGLLGHTRRITGKRTKGFRRARDLASLKQLSKRLRSSPRRAPIKFQTEHRNEIVVHRPHTCMEALVANTCSQIITKKRSKRVLTFNSTVHNFFTHQEIASTSNGPRLALKWKSLYSINAIIDLLERLDLNAESSRTSRISAQALVPYQRGGALTPFNGSFDQFRRKRPRPKVELDEETTRVWKLLLEDINSEGIDGSDEDKTRWWEEERTVFKGRADSFIARMRLVQGDRRFSPWKGSVVDSVVGVYLTQNVSDHLSSSAFMSVAARFPPNPEAGTAEFPEDNLQTDVSLSEVCMQDADEPSGLNKIVIEPKRGGSERPHDLEDDEIRLLNSLGSSGKSSEHSVAIDSLSAQLPEMSNSDPVMSHESAPNINLSLIGNGLDTDDAVSSQNSADSPNAQTNECCSLSDSVVIAPEVQPDSFTSPTSFVKLLQMADTVLRGVYGEGLDNKELSENQKAQPESLASKLQNEPQYIDHVSSNKPNILCSQDNLFMTPSLGADAECLGSSNKFSKFSDTSGGGLCTPEISGLSVEFASQTTSLKFAASSSQEGRKYFSPEAHTIRNANIEVNQNMSEREMGQGEAQSLLQESGQKKQSIPDVALPSNYLIGSIESSSSIGSSRRSVHNATKSDKNDPDYYSRKTSSGSRAKGGRIGKEKQNPVDWDNLRKQAEEGGRKRERTANTMDSVDWDAVRCADVKEIAQTIKERGMNNMLAERIKAFLNRLVQEHGSIDLEWLRDVPPDKAKEYLLSIKGLGLKSVECVRLLTLHHLAFPVDTNVGRIAVRLGWVPLQPLPESLQLHLLELYPVLESIQKYLWPRLCKLDQRTLYELHYQMITFGKVFCTKSKPNCNACPLRAECRHFASAFARSRLALPAPEERRIVKVAENLEDGQDSIRAMKTFQLPLTLSRPDETSILSAAESIPACKISVRSMDNWRLYSSHANATDTKSRVSNSQPIIEEPTSPEPTIEQVLECDIEDTFYEDPDEIPTINLNMEQFTESLQKVMQYTETEEGDMSKALLALTPEAASIPVPKLKNVSRLRTEHQVYELPDSHPLLEGMDRREPDDPSPYLLAIWTPGETLDSIEPPERRCSSQGTGKLCTNETCLPCNSIREQKSQIIPCRTAMRGSFPLNGTYFQVNEVFSDHESSLLPIDVPRQWLWNLPRRTVYFGTSVSSIFRGLTTPVIQYCFWRGFVCVRGFDRKTRAPRPLGPRFHFPASKIAKGKGKIYDE